jgi:hypothetical protein
MADSGSFPQDTSIATLRERLCYSLLELRDSDDLAAAPDLNESVDRADIVRSRAATSEVVGSVVHDADEVSAARPALQLVLTGACLQVVGAEAAEERIGAVITEDLVVASEAVADISAAAHGEPIGLVGSSASAIVSAVRECGTSCQGRPSRYHHHECHRTQQEDYSPSHSLFPFSFALDVLTDNTHTHAQKVLPPLTHLLSPPPKAKSKPAHRSSMRGSRLRHWLCPSSSAHLKGRASKPLHSGLGCPLPSDYTPVLGRANQQPLRGSRK